MIRDINNQWVGLDIVYVLDIQGKMSYTNAPIRKSASTPEKNNIKIS
jgi:hypothetical protein